MPDDPIRVTAFKRPTRANYEAQWTDPISGKTKMKSTGHKVRREAERWAGKWEKELNAGALAGPKATWEDLKAKADRDFLTNKRDATVARYRTAMRAVEKHLRPKQLTGITADAVGKLKAGMRADGNAPATVASNLRHVKALLRWAHKQGMLPKVPPIDMPRVESPAKGRPLTKAEFDLLLDAVPGVVGDDRAESYLHLLRGLWLSGLRVSEAMVMTWDDRNSAHVRLGGKFPALLIPGRLQKGGRDTVTPITPDLHRFLSQTPEVDRTGFVFAPLPARGTDRPATDWVSRTISAIGAASGLDVKDGETPKAHDLRRSFCFRWAQRVLPQQLKVLARHSAVQTTLTYYAEADAGMTAEAVAAAVAGFGDD